MTWAMDPFKKADNKAATSNNKDECQINDRHIEVAVHAIVKRREGTTRNEQVDACIIESIRYEIGS